MRWTVPSCGRPPEGIEGIEKLLLHSILALEEVDIVDKKHIHTPVFILECSHFRLLAHYRYEFVGELLSSHIHHFLIRESSINIIPYSLHQMGLSHANATVDKERVVGLSWGF